MNATQFLAAVASRLPAGINPNGFRFGEPADYLFQERGDFGLALVPNPANANPNNVPVAVVVQRFDSREFGNPGWNCWFAGADGCTADGTDWVWFAGLNATPETVAAVLTVAFGNL